MNVRLLVVLPVLLPVLLVGCGSGTEAPPTDEPRLDLPPAVCKPPVKPPAAAWFTEITDEVGLAPSGDFVPVATGVVSGDLDGDGFPDLIAAYYPNQREPAGTKRTRFLFMNRLVDGRRVFVDETEASGLLATRDGAGGRGFSVASLGDVDNDGDLDAVLCPGGGDEKTTVDPCAAFLNDGHARFTLAPESDLEAALFWTPSTTMIDFDRDGNLDFYPATIGAWSSPVKTSAPRLYRGAGDGTFTNVAREVGLPSRATTADNARINFGIETCDLDGDGDVDLLTANYGRMPNEVFVNEGGVLRENGVALGVAYDDVLDFSDDNSYRCWCSEAAGRCSSEIPPPASGLGCRGWRPGTSDDPSQLGGNTFSITCGDIDDDGDNDLMTAEVRHGDVGGSSDRSELLVNRGPLEKLSRPGNHATGLHREHTGLAWDEGDNVALFADLDLDGKKDIFLASSNYPGTHPWVFRQKEDRTFEDVTKRAGPLHASGEGPVLVDIDGDGDLDLVMGTGTFNDAATSNALRVYRNDVGQDRNFLRVRLAGKGAGFASRSAFGARVKVTAGGSSRWAELHGSTGHSSLQSDTVLTFGLGDACEVDSIEVRWPDRDLTVERFERVRANYTVLLTQGDRTVRYVR